MDDMIHYHDCKIVDQNGGHQTIKIPVVQDLSRLKNLHPNFIRDRAPNHPFPSEDTSFQPIDMEKIRAEPGSSCRVEEIEKLGQVSREWGMFVIENHGLDSVVLDSVEEVIRGFYDLPFEAKKLSVGTYASTDNMGYGRNLVKSEDQPLDWIDRMAMKAAPEGATDGLSVWPSNPANFRPVIEKYVKAARKVLDELLVALAETLSLDQHAFSKYFDPKLSEINVRVNYYPPCPRPDVTLGITPHSDGSVLTLLLQFESSNALQILRDDKWIMVPWTCKSLLVNFGDFMEVMSNGLLKSSWHRAVTQSEKDRYSVALFYNPPQHVEIEPVEEGDGDFKKVVVGEFLQNFYKVSPTPTKETTLFAK